MIIINVPAEQAAASGPWRHCEVLGDLDVVSEEWTLFTVSLEGTVFKAVGSLRGGYKHLEFSTTFLKKKYLAER